MKPEDETPTTERRPRPSTRRSPRRARPPPPRMAPLAEAAAPAPQLVTASKFWSVECESSLGRSCCMN
eukprot:5152328-Prymnesium_polylepis.1